jgi:hypothetical protein
LTEGCQSPLETQMVRCLCLGLLLRWLAAPWQFRELYSNRRGVGVGKRIPDAIVAALHAAHKG